LLIRILFILYCQIHACYLFGKVLLYKKYCKSMANAELGKQGGWVTDYNEITREADREAKQDVKDAYKGGILGGMAAAVQTPRDHAINSYSATKGPNGEVDVKKVDFAHGTSDNVRDNAAGLLQKGQNAKDWLSGKETHETPRRPGSIGKGTEYRGFSGDKDEKASAPKGSSYSEHGRVKNPGKSGEYGETRTPGGEGADVHPFFKGYASDRDTPKESPKAIKPTPERKASGGGSNDNGSEADEI
jgi:hypothetical protein